MSKNLIIVESPGKIKTLSKFLGSDYIIEASKGHIIDLPSSRIGVEPERGFAPFFSVVSDREDVVARLMAAAEKAEKVFLAPDPDREGEAISWHLANVLNIDPSSKCRITFNSITKDDVVNALKTPRPIDLNLVSAQQSRRILDRLVGFKLSPLLWKKVCLGLSAGRVQSVAVLFICKREREILDFKPEEFWTVSATVQKPGVAPMPLKLVKSGGKKSVIPDAAASAKVVEEIKNSKAVVTSIAKRVKKQTPPPPFITSTLQQEAAQKFSFTSKRTMTIAQKLYEGVEIGKSGQVGLITYMRTDSIRVAPEGVAEVRDYIRNYFPPDFCPATPRIFSAKKGAQDAHEAIRPTSVLRTPESLAGHLKPEVMKLYSLIWKRFVASQMADAVFNIVTIDVSADKHSLQTSGSTLIFPGYTAVYSETRLEDQADENNIHMLPEFSENDAVQVLSVDSKQNFTAPPPRYSESGLIKTLEKEGIGRPSTYASIIDTIQQRGYVKKVESRFRPSDAAFLVTEILTSAFGDLISPSFTAAMETLLDEIEEGKRDWVNVLHDFYIPFQEDLKKADSGISKTVFDTDYFCPKCGAPMKVRLGRAGKFLACSKYPECRTTEDLPDELVIFAHGCPKQPVLVKSYLENRKAEQKADPELSDQLCDVCKAPMVVRSGRFGRFLACSNYPACKTTKPIVRDTGIKCPMEGCNGKVVEKKSKNRRQFFGCSNYPKCTMTTWEMPTGTLCPECNAPLVQHKTKKLGNFEKCSNKACHFKKSVEEVTIGEKE